LWLLVIGAAVVLVGVGTDALYATAKNGFGFCSGFNPEDAGSSALTNWLHEKLQQAAGKSMDSPLTFGDLWKAPAMSGEPTSTDPAIEVPMITTNLTLGRPLTLPLKLRGYYFREKISSPCSRRL
jgi:hypothetical protein